MVFTTKKARFPSPGPPKSTQNRPQTHKNAKLEAKSRRKAISEALETNFETQDGDFGALKGDFQARVPNYIVMLGEIGGMAEAYSEARIERVQLEYRKISYAGHP